MNNELVPSTLKACKGTMPLDKTLQTIDEVHNKSGEGLAGLPDPELYIIVNGKPSKNNQRKGECNE